MDLYSCKVRLDGSLDNEVVKHNVTAPELHVLATIHQGQGKHPPVVDIVKTGSVNRSDIKERARLADIYTKGELVEDRGQRIITGMFGVVGVPLPQTYVAPEVVEQTEYNPGEDEEEEVITPVELPVRAASARASRKAAETAAV